MARDDIEDYGAYLAEERHASQNTVCSYLRDVNQYLHWLAGEKLLPEAPTMKRCSY